MTVSLYRQYSTPPKSACSLRHHGAHSQAKFDYPIVRHNPLFAKQKSGERSNLSSLLLGQNVRVIRRSVGGIGEAEVVTTTTVQTGSGGVAVLSRGESVDATGTGQQQEALR